MLSACAKPVHYMGTDSSTFSGLLSTLRSLAELNSQKLRVQPQLITSSFPTFPLYISPGKTAHSPLSEHYFYPVSTAPTNNCNQINLKER